MGASFSSSYGDHRKPAANVIFSTGDLHRFQIPITVSDVLLRLSQISSSSSSLSKNFFLANSDRLSYDEFIPAMSSDEELVVEQIYFVFPNSRLNHRLSASDMAELAVKASLSLNNSSKSATNRHRGQSKISPYIELEQSSTGSDYYYNNVTVKSGGLSVPLLNKAVVAGKLTTSSSLKKLQRYSSKKALLAVRSFKLSLSTIQESSEA